MDRLQRQVLAMLFKFSEMFLFTIHAFVGGAINSLAVTSTVMVVAPESFNLREGLWKVGAIMVAGGLTGAGLYLRQNPVSASSGTPSSSPENK